MNILLTNDDGLESPGILLLAGALREEGHRVLAVAPDRNRSGVSHSISFLGGPLVLSPRGDDSWACSGLPVDCVIAALLGGIPVKPDVVVSGINRGANLGTDLLYSGTAAAARQGSLFGMPSIALSLVEGPENIFHWDQAIRFFLSRFAEILDWWKADTFVNVNIPNSPQGPSGIAPAFPSRRFYHDSMTWMDAPNGDRYCFFHAGVTESSLQEGSDRELVSRNLAALSSVWIHPVSGDPRDPAARIWDRYGG
ncbi:MAG: 5'/3'-nucleotidase SurE [Treponema sp.]|jgi:5'-nucleotidase|nr:5'/3'-nucleotidase SurE [Treponema sp.]